MPAPTIAATYADALLRYAVSRGSTRNALLQRSSLRATVFDDPDGRIAIVDYVALFTAAAAALNDPAFALRFGEAVRTEDVSLVGLVAHSADSPQAGCDLLNRYGRLMLDEGDGSAPDRIAFVRERGEVWLTFSSPLYVAFPVLTESTFARCISGIRSSYAAARQGAVWPYPKSLHFTHRAPSYVAEYRRIFACPLVFGSDRNGWQMDEAFMSFRQPAPSAYSAYAVRAHADELLRRLDVSRTTRGQVERILTPLLARDVTIEQVACELGISRQTLLRRLKREGTTFEDLLVSLRRNVAVQYLTQRGLPVKRVADAVGFSDASAFSRAFKRWTGYSPRVYLSTCASNSVVVGEAANET